MGWEKVEGVEEGGKVKGERGIDEMVGEAERLAMELDENSCNFSTTITATVKRKKKKEKGRKNKKMAIFNSTTTQTLSMIPHSIQKKR